MRHAAKMAIVFFMLSALVGAYDKELKAVAETLTQRLATSGNKNVAVIDFTDLPGSTTELGRFLAEELSVDLAMVAKGFRVVDRTHLKAILQENKLASTGIIDPQTARKLGQIAGVDTLVTGTVTPFGDSVRLTVKVLDTATAEMLTATNTDIPKTKAIEELLARGIGEAVGTIGSSPTGTPSNAPVFQSALIRATVGQLAVAPDNRRVGLSVTIENTSREPLYMALQGHNNSGGATVSLSDDRATEWYLEELSGIQKLHTFYSKGKQEDFTMIAPSERLTVVMRFSKRNGGDAPGANFSFGAQGTYYTSSGLKNVSIGLPGIKAMPSK